jgi:hypothetical protein
MAFTFMAALWVPCQSSGRHGYSRHLLFLDDIRQFHQLALILGLGHSCRILDYLRLIVWRDPANAAELSGFGDSLAACYRRSYGPASVTALWTSSIRFCKARGLAVVYRFAICVWPDDVDLCFAYAKIAVAQFGR